MKRLLVVVALLVAPSTGQTASDASDIVQQSVTAVHRNLSAATTFDYCERQLTREGTKTYAVTMMLGTPYRRLTEINGQPLAAPDRQREQQKEDAERISRQREMPDERARRLQKYERETHRNKLIADELTRAFEFARETDQTVGSFDTYVFHATPRREYQPPTLEASVLTGMEGRFWIERKSYQWVKVEVTVTRPVWIAGFIARVETGTQLTLEQSPVEPDVWMPMHFSMKTRGRILLLFKQRAQLDSTFFDYKRTDNRPATDNRSAN